MKKFNYFLITFSLLLFNSSAFSYISGKATAKEELIYCPENIICTEDSNLKSCHQGDGATEENERKFNAHWGKIVASDHVFPTIYGITAVHSSYRSTNTIQTECKYIAMRYKVSDPLYYLTVLAKDGVNLEASTRDSSWEIKNHEVDCKAIGQTIKCPLKVKSALRVENYNLINGVLVSSNGVRLINTPIAMKTSIDIIYDDALTGCGGAKLCKIDLISPKGAVYGTVTVDMDNKMKILEINSVRPTEVAINEAGQFSAVKISYPDLRR